MTPNEIDAMPAGRELDALVAEKVMMWSCIHRIDAYEVFVGYVPGQGWKKENQCIPYYSRDIAAAWRVVEKVGLDVDYQTNTVIVRKNLVELGRADNNAPLAICRAALKTVLDGEKQFA